LKIIYVRGDKLMSEVVKLEVSGENGLIMLNRPEKRNAINGELMEGLRERLLEAEQDKNIRSIIIHGAGKCFSSGIDLNFLAGSGQLPSSAGVLVRKSISELQSVFTLMERIEKPIICAMHYVCFGMAMELCLGADFRIMTSDCRFSIPEVALGLIPDIGGTTRLVRLVGLGNAKEIIMTADEVSAEKALSIGLINRIAEPGKHLEEAFAFAELLNRNGPLAIGLAKRIIDRGLHMDKFSIMELEALAQSLLITTDDFKEGIAARIEKRKPDFKGA
jgi:enoyl-CoA hydratase/carnithine racemase